MPFVSELGSTLFDNSHIVVDVRSPQEYQRGHVPGAFNIPLLSNTERAIVGTVYAKHGSEAAIETGMELVAPKFGDYLAVIKDYQLYSGASAQLPLIVYCWRGGLRSASLSWFFNQAGYASSTIVGGYKAYRRMVLEQLEFPWRFVVIGGYTGSGKTEILHELHKRGRQVLDLEALCNHRGSAFGAVHMPPQPKSEHAMNLVHHALSTMDAQQTIFVEDESQHIGSVWLHEPLFAHIRKSPLLFLELPQAERAAYLSTVYGAAGVQELEESFRKIVKPLGADRLSRALNALRNNDLQSAASEALDHYDRAYRFGLQKRGMQPALVITHNTVSITELANRIEDHGY